jgi:hypothetical protein
MAVTTQNGYSHVELNPLTSIWKQSSIKPYTHPITKQRLFPSFEILIFKDLY